MNMKINASFQLLCIIKAPIAKWAKPIPKYPVTNKNFLEKYLALNIDANELTKFQAPIRIKTVYTS